MLGLCYQLSADRQRNVSGTVPLAGCGKKPVVKSIPDSKLPGLCFTLPCQDSGSRNAEQSIDLMTANPTSRKILK